MFKSRLHVSAFAPQDHKPSPFLIQTFYIDHMGSVPGRSVPPILFSSNVTLIQY
jgi:hypothetical protein